MKLFDNIWKFLHPYDEVGEDDPIDYQTQERPERERPEREHTCLLYTSPSPRDCS